MGELNQTPMMINGVEGEVGQVKVAQGPSVCEQWQDLPAGGAAIWVGKTEVYNGLSPLAMTDLDLSSFESLGANKALVLLVFTSTGDMNAVAVKAKGDASNYYDAAVEANAYGVALGHHDANADMVLLCTTDANGIIQWQTETEQTAQVYMLAYIK